MRKLAICIAASIAGFLAGTANAAIFVFNTDPFAGSTALTTPGRQVVGGEPSITFNAAADQFVFDTATFGAYGFGPAISFANDIAGNLPTSGANVIVLRSFDDDANTATPFGAGNAATLIANRVTAPGAGFFIYFNQGLDLPRLVFSTNLDDPTADLKIIARMTNLTGTAGQTALAGFTGANFRVAAVPEPGMLLLLAMSGLGLALVSRR